MIALTERMMRAVAAMTTAALVLGLVVVAALASPAGASNLLDGSAISPMVTAGSATSVLGATELADPGLADLPALDYDRAPVLARGDSEGPFLGPIRSFIATSAPRALHSRPARFV